METNGEKNNRDERGRGGNLTSFQDVNTGLRNYSDKRSNEEIE